MFSEPVDWLVVQFEGPTKANINIFVHASVQELTSAYSFEVLP